MEVCRLTRDIYARPDGEGAYLYGGRWNFPYTAIVYTSPTLSLAILEYLVHLDTDLVPTNVVTLSATIPDAIPIERIHVSSLPHNWRTVQIHPALQRLGTDWVNRGETAVLQVPSAIVPPEHNILLNPNHPDFERITWYKPTPFIFDSRLFK
jgi:RES domain-containing protein